MVKVSSDLRWPTDLHEDHSVTGHSGGECVFERSEIFSQPQVADRLRAAQAEIGPAHRDVLRSQPPIEQSDGMRAVGERARPDLQPSLLAHTRSGFAERILVDVEDLIVGQERERESSSRERSAPMKSGAA